MADPLSIAASIAGLISLADIVFTRAMKYVRSAKNADEDVTKLSREALALSGALSSLSKLAQELDAAGIRDKPIEDLRMHHIAACHATLDRIAKGLKKLDDGNALKRKVVWPFTSERTQESLREVSRHKETINLALTATSMDTLLRILSKQEETHVKVQEIYEDVRKTGRIVSRIHQDAERSKVLDYFLIYNPQQNYETSLALRHPRTGIWLTLLPAFQTWLSTPDSYLWLSGIPGAGKTVIAATIIEESLKRSTESVATIFFFCDYKDTKTQSPENILCVLASQLAIQNEAAYSLLEQYYQKLHPQRSLEQRPQITDLQTLLGDMTKSFDHVYLNVDGLDECGASTGKVIDILLDIIDASDNISTAFLSRDEDHIRSRLENDFENVEIAAHTEDITEYVTSELEKRIGDRRLRLSDLGLKGEILDRLVEGANGMFRWVACQLDSLEYCHSDKDCRTALDRLPPGLDESYARILQQVPKGQELLVQKILNFIAYAIPKLKIYNLRHALSVPDTVRKGQALDPHSIVHEDTIPKLCKSLVRKSNDDNHYEFAHFTVQEFLEGAMSSMPDLEAFQISMSICNRLLAVQCLNYLQFKDFDHWPSNDEEECEYMASRHDLYPFYEHAAFHWPRYARNEWMDQSLIASATTLFNPAKTGNFTSWSLELLSSVPYKLHGGLYEAENTIMRLAPQVAHKTFTPLHMAAVLSLPSICSALLKDVSLLHRKSAFGTPLQCAAQGLLIVVSDSSHQVNGYDGRMMGYYHGGTRGASPEGSKSPMADIIHLFLEAGATYNSICSGPFVGFSLISMTLLAARVMTDSLFATEALLKFDVDLHEEDLQRFDELANDYIDGYRQDDLVFGEYQDSLVSFLRSLSPMIDRSTTHFKLCQKAWSLYVTLTDPSTLDSFMVDTRVSFSEEAFMDTLFSTIKYGDLDELSRILKDPRLDTPKTVGQADGRFVWSAASRLSYDRALDTFKVLLNAGWNVSQTDSDGNWPVHVLSCLGHSMNIKDDEAYERVCGIIREFVCRGTGCTVLTQKRENVLHLGCSAPAFIKAFLEYETEENVSAALETQDENGYTPITFALAQGREECALLLLEKTRCRPGILQGSVPILALCVNMNAQKAFDFLGGADMEAQADGTNEEMILHYISYKMTAGFLRRVISLYPHACAIRKHGRLPLDIYLNNCLCRENPQLDTEVLGILATTVAQEVGVEEKGLVWEAFMSSIQEARGHRLEKDYSWRQINQDRQMALERAALHPDLLSFMEAYELTQKVSAILPLLEPYQNTLHHLSDMWPISVATIQYILCHTSSCFWEQSRNFAMVLRLLKAAVKDNNVELVTLLLVKGVSVHERTDKLSALELACSTPTILDESKIIFTQLLDHANTSQLNEISPNLDQQKGLIHYLVGPSKEWQIRELFEKSADPDLRTSDEFSRPALVYHLQKGSVDSALVLLENGANPNQTASHGADAALTAAWQGSTRFLSKLVASTAWKVDWQKTANFFDTIRGKRRDIDGQNALHLAAGEGHVGCLVFYLDNNLLTDLNATTIELFTPVHLAAIRGKVDSISFLCDRGANINSETADGSLPLHFAVQNQYVEAVKYLVEHGSEMDTDNAGMSPMAYARQTGNMQIIEYLGQHSQVSTNAPEKDMKRVAQAFEDALLRRDFETCQELVSQGFRLDSELPGCNGRTPLIWAVNSCEHKAIEWLLTRDVDTVSIRYFSSQPRYASPLGLMIAYSELNGFLPEMLDKYQSDGGSILAEKSIICTAVKRNNILGLQLLLDHVQKYEEPHSSDTGILHQPTYIAANQRTSKGDTALHLAASQGNFDAATLLIDNDADIDAVGYYAQTPLHQVAWSVSPAHTLVAELLIRKGAGTEVRGNFGRTPLILASRKGNIEVVKLLIDGGANLHASDHKSQTALHLCPNVGLFTSLVNHGLDPHQRDTRSWSAIHYAMRWNSFTSFLLNCDLGLENSEPFAWERTICSLPMAWLTSHYILFLRKLGLENMRKLAHLEPPNVWAPLCIYASMGLLVAVTNFLSLGARVDFEGCPSGSALMVACSAGKLKIVKALVRRGASITYDGVKGFRSAVDAARRSKAIVDWLLVGRFTEQKKISGCEHLGPSENTSYEKLWSGVAKAEVVISGTSERRRDESVYEYWRRLMAIKRDWRGKVVPEKSRAKTCRQARLIPEESVRICAGGYETSREVHAKTQAPASDTKQSQEERQISVMVTSADALTEVVPLLEELRLDCPDSKTPDQRHGDEDPYTPRVQSPSPLLCSRQCRRMAEIP